MSLRQRQVDARRHAILDAAALLIRRTGTTDFSMRALADEAGVSPATPYNLFSSKDGLLYSLLARSLDEVVFHGLSFTAADPLDRVLEAAERAADVFIQDPGFIRPLYQFLLGVIDPVHRPAFVARSLEYWDSALEAAAPMLAPPFDRRLIKYTLMGLFMGELEFWIHDDVSAEAFRARVTYGTVLVLLPMATDAQRTRLLRRMREAQRTLAPAGRTSPGLSLLEPAPTAQRKKDPRR